MFKYAAFLGLALAITATAQAEPKQGNRPLESSLGWLIGTWENADTPADSGPAAIEMSFKWAAGKEVIVWEGTYPAKEATWSFVAVIFFDPAKDRVRVFAFNSTGRRHLGVQTTAGPGEAAWKMSGLLPDGRTERFVMEFVRGEDDTLTFNLKGRVPDDGGADGSPSVKLRRKAVSGEEHL